MEATTGSLALKPFAHLLAFVLQERISGSLELSHADGALAATIVFRRGFVERIKTAQPVAYLGSVVYELGFIDDAELNASLLELSRMRRPHGQILLGRGAITREQLEVALREQTLRKLAYVSSLDGSTGFTFREGIDLLGGYGGTEPVLVDPCAAIWRSISESASTPHVRAIVDRLGGRPCRLAAGARIDKFPFSPDELTIVECLGARPFRLVELHALGLLEPARTELVVYCLLITRHAEVVALPAGAVPPEKTTVPAPPPPTRTGPRMKAVHRAEDPAARAMFIRARARAIKSEDFFQRLSVPRDAMSEQIDRQFIAHASLWDPAALPPELDEVRDDCRVILDALAEAHRTLLDPRKREQYARQLLLGNPNEPAEDLAASGKTNELDGARACLAKNDLERAERMARRAHKARPGQARPLALLAWIEANKPSTQDYDAIRTRIAMLDRAIAFEPECDEALQYRWQLHRRVENHRAAVRDLQRLLALDPTNVEAERELRIYEMRVRSGSVKMPAVRPSSTSGVMPKQDEPVEGFFKRLLKKP